MRFLGSIAEYGFLLWELVGHSPRLWADRKRLARQLEKVGVQSLPLVLLTGFFSGAIISMQTSYQIKGFVPLSFLGGQVARVIVMEIGPILTGLIMAGRIGASMAAELGAMTLTEQVDALRSLSLDPVRYLVLPRVAAMGFMLPVLTIFANLTALLGALAVSMLALDMTPTVFLDSVREYLQVWDFVGGLVKAFFFGLVMASLGSFVGLRSTGGAEGIGRTTILAFVLIAMTLLAVDFLLGQLLF